MPHPIQHFYLSPHFDDAVLSCGGMIHQQARAGQRVVVVTVCAGSPPPGPLSPYAALLHTRWGMPPEGGSAVAAVVARRRAEDAAALARLGAEGRYLDVPDVIYRRDARADGREGGWIVEDDASLFRGELPGEQARVAAVARQLVDLAEEATGGGFGEGAGEGVGTVYAPLGVGGHVDHWLVRRAAEAWAVESPVVARGLVHYEDYPYSADPGAIEQLLGLGTSASAWQPQPIDLDEADLRAKIDAIAAYTSQISTFWTDVKAMDAAVRAFAQGRGGAGGAGERLWISGDAWESNPPAPAPAAAH